MYQILNNLYEIIAFFQNIAIINIIDMLLVSILIFFCFYYSKKYNASYVIKFTTVLITVFFVARVFNLIVTAFFVREYLIFGSILFVVLFSPEIKRAIWKRSKTENLSDQIIHNLNGSDGIVRQNIEAIISACQNMSKANCGALILIVPSSVPIQIVESGVVLDAAISPQLIQSIFFPNSSLHDGAMLLSDEKIIAAGCFLPLSQDTSIPKELGTRHRAAIGITEITDVLAIVVSEETGVISLVHRGNMVRYANYDMLLENLERIYGMKDLDGEIVEG